MVDDASQLGARVRELRKMKGLSIERLAELAGLHRNFVGEIERGNANPSVSSLSQLADALGVPSASLFDSYADLSIDVLRETLSNRIEHASREELLRLIRLLEALGL